MLFSEAFSWGLLFCWFFSNPTVQMCRGLCLGGWAPLPTDMTPRANKHLKLQIRPLDSIASWHSRKWLFHAQIRGFAKMNTQSNTEEDGLKMPLAEPMHTAPRLACANSWTFSIYCCTAIGCAGIPLWSPLRVKCSVLTAVRLPACGAHEAFHNFPRIFFWVLLWIKKSRVF